VVTNVTILHYVTLLCGVKRQVGAYAEALARTEVKYVEGNGVIGERSNVV